jgi:hypothetical protein
MTMMSSCDYGLLVIGSGGVRVEVAHGARVAVTRA